MTTATAHTGGRCVQAEQDLQQQSNQKNKNCILSKTIFNKLIMLRNTFFGLALLITLSCNKEESQENFKQENGKVWLSGGLYYCAEQLCLDNGDTLVVSSEDIISFTSGDRVNVKYKEMGVNEFCPPFIDCEIIEITKIE